MPDRSSPTIVGFSPYTEAYEVTVVDTGQKALGLGSKRRPGKKFGTTTVLSQDGSVLKTSSPNKEPDLPTGKDVGVVPGDSGGPLIHNNRIAGIASRTNPGWKKNLLIFNEPTKEDHFIDLSSQSSKTFLHSLIETGVPIAIEK